MSNPNPYRDLDYQELIQLLRMLPRDHAQYDESRAILKVLRRRVGKAKASLSLQSWVAEVRERQAAGREKMAKARKQP